MIARLFNIWRLNREINRNLAARKALRPYRQASAHKAVQTRKANAHG